MKTDCLVNVYLFLGFTIIPELAFNTQTFIMSSTAKSPQIELGLSVLLREKSDWIQGKSIGLITNHTGIDADLQSNYRLFAEAPACQLSAIFSPEHGLWGAVQDGIAINSRDEVTSPRRGENSVSVPVFSLYGQSMRPTASQLEGIDVLVYDMQDVGARYYTYISTLLHAMEAASDCGIEFVVADRPNPITCTAVEGPVLESGSESFVGIHTIPVRYGLTIGELAVLLKAERVPSCQLKVAWMRGYKRGMWYDDTGLPWVPPSPNMPTLTTAVLYPGLCLFEGTNMSEGRGTTKPFEYIGAPWCDGERWAELLNNSQLPGVRFRPVVFTPAPAHETTKHAKQTCSGVAIHITDRTQFQPIETALQMLSILTTEYRDDFEFLPAHFDRLAGNTWLRDVLLNSTSVDTIQARWVPELQTWRDNTTQYHAYA
jgi:beta-N-acetylhexosaminidase